MSPEGSIAVERVWKRFRPDRRAKRLRSWIDDRRHAGAAGSHGSGSRRKAWTWALRDADFVVEPGESVGLVGMNGSGKSTLLKLLTRVMYPSAGSIVANGRVGALIEVASGIHPQLSGGENIYLYGSLLGLRRRDVTRRFDDIVDFAEVGHAVNRQVKFYSSGMKMRLGFAVAAFLEPDILLVDEVLAVGDSSFQQRCLARMEEVHSQGTTLVYVSHDLPTVEAACNRGIWLDQGVILADGPVRDVLGRYRSSIEERVEEEGEPGWQGDEEFRLLDARVSGGDGGVPRTGRATNVDLVLGVPASVDAELHLGITEGPGTPIVAARRELHLPSGKNRVRACLDDLPLPAGRFYVWLSVRSEDRSLLPWAPATTFDVVGPDLDPTPRGVVRLAPVYCDVSWESEDG